MKTSKNVADINRAIRSANNSMHPVTIQFEGETRTYSPGEARALGSADAPGVYLITIDRTSEGSDKVEKEEFLLTVDAPEASPIPREIPEASLKDPTLLIFELRKQDQQAMAQERKFFQDTIDSLKREHQNDILRIRAEHQTELQRVRQDYEFQKSLIENNQTKLESDRSNMLSVIEKRLRAEQRFGKNANDFAIVDKLTENPIAMMLAAKFAGFDPKELLPLLMAGAGGNGEMDLSKFIPGLPPGANLSNIAEALTKGAQQ